MGGGWAELLIKAEIVAASLRGDWRDDSMEWDDAMRRKEV